MQFIGSKVTIYYIVGRPLIHDVLFYFLSEVFGYQLGCTVAAVSFQQPVEHVKNTVLYKSSRMRGGPTLYSYCGKKIRWQNWRHHVRANPPKRT